MPQTLPLLSILALVALVAVAPAVADTDAPAAADTDAPADPCDGLELRTWYEDGDGDGYGRPGGATVEACRQPPGWARTDDDCDDEDPTVHPNAPESCEPPYEDKNCDGSVGDEDADDDGFRACEDCDDTNRFAYPGAPEIWYDGVIFDCTSLSDFDADRDGYESELYGGDDCDDFDPSVNPSAPPRYNIGYDNNCDGVIYEDPLADEDIALDGCDGCRSAPAGAALGALAMLPFLLRRRWR